MKIIITWGILVFSLNALALTNDVEISSVTNNPIQQDVYELLEMTGTADLSMQVMQQMIASFQQAMPDVPREYWGKFMAQVNPQEFLDMLVPIYQKHFTHEEIRGLISFYKSPLGKNLVEKQPIIFQESYLAGEAWGRRLSETVLHQLQEEGYLDDHENEADLNTQEIITE